LRISVPLALIGLLEATCIRAQTQTHTISLEVRQAHSVRASIGDVVIIQSETYPLVPANLRDIFRVSYDHDHLELIAESPHGPDGKLGREFYFKVMSAGEANITVITLDGERVLRSSKVEIAAQ
jgi:hypothetical protein